MTIYNAFWGLIMPDKNLQNFLMQPLKIGWIYPKYWGKIFAKICDFYPNYLKPQVLKWGSEGYGVDRRCGVAEVKGVTELLGSTELGGVVELSGGPE